MISSYLCSISMRTPMQIGYKNYPKPEVSISQTASLNFTSTKTIAPDLSTLLKYVL